MTATQRTIAKTRRRLTLRAGLFALGWCLLVAAALCIVMLLTAQWFGGVLAWWVYASVAGVALVVAAGYTLTRKHDDAEVAVLIDERLGLRDRLGTSLYASTLDDNELTRQVIDEAERVSANADVQKAFPILPERNRAWMGFALAVLIFAGLQFDPFGLLQRAEAIKAQQAAAEEQAEALQETLAEVAEEAEQIEEDKERGTADALDPADLDELLEAMLSQHDLSNPEDLKKAEAEVSELQEKFDESLAQQEAEAEAQQNAMSQLDSGDRGPGDRFADSLRRSDFAAAQRELGAMMSKIESGDMTEEEKERLGEQLGEMAEQLSEMAEQQEKQGEQIEQQMRKELEEAGLSKEEIDELAKQGMDQQQVQEKLQEKGQSKQQAQQQAQKANQQQKQAKNCKSSSQQCKGASSKMGQMSKSVKNQKNGQPSNSQTSQSVQQMQKQLGQMAQQQQKMKNMKSASQKMKDAQQALAKAKQKGQGGKQQGKNKGKNMAKSPPSNSVGPGEGRGAGGNPIGQERAALNTASHASRDIQDGEGGRVMTSWTKDGQTIAGDAKVSYNQTVTEARNEAERAVNEDGAPKRYHKAIKEYMGNLPEAEEE